MDILAVYLRYELQNHRALFAYVLLQCKAIKDGESDSFDDYGDTFRTVADIDGVRLSGPIASARFSLDEFLAAIKSSLDAKLQNESNLIRDLYNSLTDSVETDLESFASALEKISYEAHLLSDLDAVFLFEVFLKQMQVQKLEHSKINAQLIDKIADANIDGYAKNFILHLAQEFMACDQLQEANYYMRKAATNHIAKNKVKDLNQRPFTQHLIKIYLELLSAENKAVDFEAFQTDYNEIASSIAHLHLGLYKQCGLYNEYLQTTGMSSLADNLHMMIRGLNADTMPNPQHAPVRKAMSKHDLESLLKVRITKNASAAADYKHILDLSSQIESSYAKLNEEKSLQYPELLELLKDDISFVLATADSLRMADGDLLEIDVDPDTNLAENTPEAYKFSDVAIDIEQIPQLLPWLKTKYNPEPGSPNAEPLILWNHHKYGLMLVTHTLLARQMSRVVLNYVDYFHHNKATALPRIIEDFQNAFAGEKRFLDQSFSELAAFYQAAQRPEQAELFVVPLVVLEPENPVSLAEPALVKIYIPMELMSGFESLNMDLPMQIVTQNLQWDGIEGEENETLTQAPGQKFYTMSIETQEPEPMVVLCKSLLKKYPGHDKLYLSHSRRIEKLS